MEDKILDCKEGNNCLSGGTFKFTVKDQQFYAQNNYTEPRRCRPCRQRKKNAINNAQQ